MLVAPLMSALVVKRWSCYNQLIFATSLVNYRQDSAEVTT